MNSLPDLSLQHNSPVSSNGHLSEREHVARTVADAIVAGGIEKGREVLNTLARANGTLPPAQSSPFQFITSAQLKTLPRVGFLLDGLLQDNGINVVFGPPKQGKSFVVLLLASEVAQQMPVLYCAGEGFPGYAARVEALELAYKRSVGRLSWHRSVNLFDDNAVSEFIEAAREHGFKLIIFDTLASCMIGADENSNRDMQRVISNCQRIIDELGCALILVHHTTKAGQQYRGASALQGGADMMIELTNDDGLIGLSCDCSKNSEGFEPRYYRLVQFGPSVAALPSARVVTRGAALTSTQKKVLEALNIETFTPAGARAVTLQRITGLSDSSLFRALGKLKREGYITQAKEGDPYFISDKGKQAIEVPLPPLPEHSHGSDGSSQTTTTTTPTHL